MSTLARALEASGIATVALLAGELDVLCLIASPESDIVRQLLLSGEVETFSFRRSAAYARTHRFLSEVTLPEGMSTEKLFDKAIANKVAYVPGSAFYPEGESERSMRLNFSYASEDQIEVGIARLGLAKDTPIYLYCAVGGRAEKARQSLVASGYSNVTNAGGLENARQLAADSQP